MVPPGEPILYCSEDGDHGYGIAGWRTFFALRDAGVELAWQPLNDDGVHDRAPTPPTPRSDPMLAALAASGGHYSTVIAHAVPSGLPHVRETLRPDRLIAVVAWETAEMPRAWHELLRGVEQVWVPCRWNQDALRASGLSMPIEIVPHPVAGDTGAAASEALPIDVADDVCVFTTVLSWCARKGPVQTIEAFCRAFTADDPVLLVVKAGIHTWGIAIDDDAPGRYRGTTVWELQRILRRHPKPPKVMLVTERWTRGQMVALLQRSDCYLSLARAEGWGLDAFDAASCGTPVVITGYGGQLDYLGHDYPGLVPYQLVPVDFPTMEGWFEPQMQWADPDLDAAAALLRAIASDPAHPCRTAATALAPVLHERFAPARVGAAAKALLSC